jgi:ABC-type Zn2+ transport system substrate-binding protein/surface adhesin
MKYIENIRLRVNSDDDDDDDDDDDEEEEEKEKKKMKKKKKKKKMKKKKKNKKNVHFIPSLTSAAMAAVDGRLSALFPQANYVLNDQIKQRRADVLFNIRLD